MQYMNEHQLLLFSDQEIDINNLIDLTVRHGEISGLWYIATRCGIVEFTILFQNIS